MADTDKAHEIIVAETINRHIRQLRSLVAADAITIEDHDTIGAILQAHIGHLLGLSNAGWRTFVRIINESREVQYGQRDTRDASPDAPR